MKSAARYVWIAGCLALLAALPSIRAAEDALSAEDARTLRDAGLSSNGSALLAFFQARAGSETDFDHTLPYRLLQQSCKGSAEERMRATSQLLGLGPLALPALRKAAGDLDRADLAERAERLLPWLEGSSSHRLLAAAARALAIRKPDGAAAALLSYLPCADDAEVIRVVQAALADVALADGKADPSLLRALSDPLCVRRAAAAIALSNTAPPEQMPAVRKLFNDPSPRVRLRTALALAEAHDETAIPVLIELLGELSAEERKPIEEFLTQLAGEWTPALQFHSEDKIGRRIRRDAWASWWRNVDADSLLAAVREKTPTAESRAKVKDLIGKLDSDEFNVRENATKELFALGRLSLPQLRDAARSKDAELVRRAKQLIDRIERDPVHHLPAAALRLLALRKPPGSVEALIAYMPYAEDESLSSEVEKSLTALARHDGKPHPALLAALKDARPALRAAIAEALVNGGGPEGHAAAHALLTDDSAEVRLRVALALAKAKDRDGVPVLIDLLTVLPLDRVGEVEDALLQLAGDTAPETAMGTEAAERKKCREAWLGWWKVNARRADLARLTTRSLLGYTLVCDLQGGRVYELDRQRKQRWMLTGLGAPCDAQILPGNHVLIAEYGPDRVTERDLQGNVVWEKRISNPVNVQRLPNGNTFVATFNGPLFEFDRTGKEVLRINNRVGNTMAAKRTRRGHIVVLTQNGQCAILDSAGKELKTFATGHQNSLGAIDVLSNGHILVTQQNRNKVVEFDTDGKSVREVDAPNAMSATGLFNGHILVAAQNAQRVYEVDRAGKIVWEHPNAGQAVRARRR